MCRLYSSSRWSLKIAAAVLALHNTAALAEDDFPGIGRAATPAEVRAWDTDVRADFKGLPPGQGSVKEGAALYRDRCADCHGARGESGAMFIPLIGGTTAEDITTGKVAGLVMAEAHGKAPFYPTLFMKLATVSTLFDYIQRAMPWTNPKSLNPDEVYALVAFLLNLAEIVPQNFILNDSNIVEVQQMLPNRNGMSTDHGLWPGASAEQLGLGNGGIPDVSMHPCMTECGVGTVVRKKRP
jgi:mono/diheme cytochrome c family protein